VVQSCERLDEHIHTLISELIASSGEEIQGVVGIKVVVAIEVASDKVVNLLLGLLMQILELVDRGEFRHVQAVGKHTIRLSLEKMLRLEGGDVRNCGEDVAGMSSGTLDAVSVVDTALASLRINIEPLEVIVEIDRAGTKVSSKKSGVSGKDGSDIDASLLGQRQSDTGEPLVEVGNDRLVLLVTDKLGAV
jgi:hypothetical protein